MNLCPEETRSLLVKYFNKVIDLRIEFRKQEISFSDLEVRLEDVTRCCVVALVCSSVLCEDLSVAGFNSVTSLLFYTILCEYSW